MFALVFSGVSLCSAQWATQPLLNTQSWNSIATGYASGLNGAQMGYPLLGNRLAAGSFGYGTGTIGASTFGTASFPLSAVGVSATPLVMPSSYPMGNVVMPAAQPMQPPPNPNTVAGANAAEKKQSWNKEWAEQQDANAEVYDPMYRWDQYKASFEVTAGVPSDYNDNVARTLLSMDKWWTAMMDTESARSLVVPFHGASAPRYNTFPTPGSPAMPVVPCPVGTPEYICAQAASNLGNYFPTAPEFPADDEEMMKYAYYQNLMQRNYPGFGPVYPRSPINGQPSRQVGPNPSPFAARAPLNCDLELDYEWEVNTPGMEMYERGSVMVAEIMYKCACTTTGVPIMSQCTKAVLDEGEAPTVDVDESGDVEYEAFDQGASAFPSNVFGDVVAPCGNFATYNPNVPCKTVLSEGFTPEPPLRIAGPQAAQPQTNGEGPWFTDPYDCSVEVAAVLYFNSPLAWENNYDAEYSLENGNVLECLCDRYHNPILNSCRQAIRNAHPIVGSGGPEYWWGQPAGGDDSGDGSDDDSVRRREARGSAREARQAGEVIDAEEDEVDVAVRKATEAAETAQTAAEYAVKLAKNAERIAKKSAKKRRNTLHKRNKKKASSNKH